MKTTAPIIPCYYQHPYWHKLHTGFLSHHRVSVPSSILHISHLENVYIINILSAGSHVYNASLLMRVNNQPCYVSSQFNIITVCINHTGDRDHCNNTGQYVRLL